MTMSDIVIKAVDLSKQYKIGEKVEKYKTLRDTVSSAALWPIHAVNRLSRAGKNEANADRLIWALKDVSFEVERGEVLGIIGRNGAGKSTLLKILSRITEPTSGYVDVSGRVGSLLEVGTGFHPELTGRENVLLNGAILGMRKVEIAEKFDDIVGFAGIERFIDTPVKHYSSGMYLRLAFAVAAHLEPEILLVDEVLAVGDAEFQKRCVGKMRDVARGGRTVLFVSHNMEALLNLCTTCIVISDGGVAFAGSPEAAINFYYNASSGSKDSGDSHVLFAEPEDRESTRITRIELLDELGAPKTVPYTWDDVVFRIHYHSEEDVRNGSIILDVRDLKDQRLIVLDSGLAVPLKQGDHFVDCVVPRLSLPAGEFFLAGGLTRSNYQWLWRESHLGRLQIYGSDVLKLGRPPIYSRMMFVSQQEWHNGSGIAVRKESKSLNQTDSDAYAY
jgi:lipopolysaccharide transport system ATP-binding protein